MVIRGVLPGAGLRFMRFPWQKQKPLVPEQVAAEFVEYLRVEWVEIQVKEFDTEHLELVMPDGTDAKLFLHKLHGALAAARNPNEKARRQLYAGFAQQMLAADKQIPPLESLDPALMAAKVFPRVVAPALFEALQNDMDKAAPPRRPLADSDFQVVYVLDFDDRVAYVMKAQAEALQMDEEQLWQTSMANARTLFPREECRAALSQLNPKKVVHFLECRDGHAGARLLLLPEYLEEGEEAAAVILENSAFLLAQVPPGNNWNPLRTVARQGGSPHVQQPFLVSRQGIKAM